MEDDVFRKCAVCGATWHTLNGFLSDPAVRLVGLQAVPSAIRANVLVFLHQGCGSISVKTSTVRELLQGQDAGADCGHLPGPAPAPGSRPEPCDGCYRDLEELGRCRKSCVIASDRELTLRLLATKGRR